MRCDNISEIFGASFSHQNHERKSRCLALLICVVTAATICNIFQLYMLYLKLSAGEKPNMLLGITKETIEAALNQPSNEVSEEQQTCNFLGEKSDYCDMEGDIRIEAKSSTIFIVSPNHIAGNNTSSSWSVKPYAKKENSDAMNNVKKWTVKLVGNDGGAGGANIPVCSLNHSIPAILFSTGGFVGNTFHDYSDLLVPIFANSQQFKREVQFLVTDYFFRWISTHKVFFSNLSRHPIVAIDEENQIHCYPRMLLGLKSQQDLIIDSSQFPNDSSSSMNHFRQFLRSTYSLERTKAIKLMKKKRDERKPRLMLISRSKGRLIRNEAEIARKAENLGFEVIVAEARNSTNVTLFAQLVNSCDVLTGVHGAGLTNMVFLPDNAVLVQIIPYGGIEAFARNDFGKPSTDMKINYLQYEILVTESSLMEQYPLDHAVLRDPYSFRRMGWGALKSTYLDKQDVRINLRRFGSVLGKAIKILMSR